ncbi:MAG: hypothetical protein QM535_07830 [Limnohabitans sp.]|nr:hypothetical protein [Limnohabitans sp.]
MKKNIIITFLTLYSVFGYSQNKEEILQKLAKNSCDCVNKKNSPQITDIDFGICIIESLSTLNEKEQKVIGYNPKDGVKAIEKLTEPIGIQLALTCPQVLTQIKDKKGKSLMDDDLTSHSGIVEEIIVGDFKKIRLKSDKNEVLEFLWLFKFSNDSVLLNNKVIKGDKVEITYTIENLFDAKTNTYKSFNIIKEIKFL